MVRAHCATCPCQCPACPVSVCSDHAFGAVFVLILVNRPVRFIDSHACISRASLISVFENYVELMHVDEQQVELSLWDTAGEWWHSPYATNHTLIPGQEDFSRLRSLSYADTNVILLCFSVSLYIHYADSDILT